MDPALTAPDRPRLAMEEFQNFSKGSDVRSVFVILLTYGAIIALLTFVTLWPRWWFLTLAFVIVAGLQHGISILQHEAVHFLLFRNKKFNDAVGNIILSYPIGFTMHYRNIHLAHHGHLGEDNDPDLVNYESFPNTLSFFLTIFLRNITGVSALRQSLEMLGVRPPSDPHMQAAKLPRVSRWHIVGLALTQLLIFGLFASFSHWWFYLVLWIAPLLTLTKTFTNMRNAVEHTSIVPDPHAPFARYRTILATPLEKFFLAPFNFNYHSEHHLYPGIPYYKLPKVHQRMAEQPSYKKYVHVIPGYMHFVRKYMVKDSAPRS